MPSAAYYRAWRRANPAYMARERERSSRRQRGDRSAEYRATNVRKRALWTAMPPMPGLHTGHALFDRARAVVGQRITSFTHLYDALYDDLMSEAVLALLEERDPEEAVARYRSIELSWLRRTCELTAAA